MKKDEIIARFGEGAYEKKRVQARKWNLDNPEKARALTKKRGRKGGEYYLKKREYESTGLQGERHMIRVIHANKWRQYKKIIAPESQIHHAWRVGTAEYDGVALVEKNAHRHGIIDVIRILDGEIPVLTEAELKAK